MSITVNPIANETVVLTVGDHLDFRNAPEFKDILQNQILSGTRKFILDFSDTKSFDSTGLGSLFTLYRQLTPLNGVIYFASASNIVKNTVELTRTDRLFAQFETVEEAQEAVSTHKQ